MAMSEGGVGDGDELAGMPFFYLGKSTAEAINNPCTPHRDVRAYRAGFSLPEGQFIPVYIEPVSYSTSELIKAACRLVETISLDGLVKPSAKNPNAGFVDMRDWYALQGEVDALRTALLAARGRS